MNTVWTILALVIAGPILVGLFLALVMARLGRDLDEDARRRRADELLDLDNHTD